MDKEKNNYESLKSDLLFSYNEQKVLLNNQYKEYKILLWCLFGSFVTIIVVIAGVLGYSTNSQIDSMNEKVSSSLKAEEDKAQNKLKIAIDSVESELENTLSNEVKLIRGEIAAKIEDEFKKENIEIAIKKKFSELTDQYISELAKNAIKPIEDSLEIAIDEAHRQLKKLNNFYYITNLADEAKCDSREAFYSLKKNRNESKGNKDNDIFIETIYLSVLNSFLPLITATPNRDFTFDNKGESVNFSSLTLTDEIELLFSERTTLDLTNIMKTLIFQKMENSKNKDDFLSLFLREINNSNRINPIFASCWILSKLYISDNSNITFKNVVDDEFWLDFLNKRVNSK
ncbi:MAG: hypothetical protein PHW04_14515 [Candidatus Wallbacteria bacterium]|nr:hypothetical protein [Candidatus Wallbacteria bacterium]